MNATHTNPRLREDLVWCCHATKGLDRWALQDPINGEFYYFTSIEKDVLDLFEGTKSLSEIYQDLKRRKPGCDWSMNKLTAFLQLLMGHNLVLWDQYGRGSLLAAQASRQRTSNRYRWLLQPLSIRVPLFKPVLLLKILSPVGAFLFHPLVQVLLMSVALVTAIATALRWSEIVTSLPPLETLMRGDRIVLMALTLAVIKSLHELGHAMACHRYTRESGEIGLLFLVFTPCLYCDVSPSWKLRSRWQRASIALAGIYIEVLLATLAIFLLAFVSSEVVRSIAFSVCIVCSLGTFFVNGNPLLKYDGYFALSDLLGIPNLAEQAREAALSIASQWFTKAPTLPAPLDGSRYFLIAYWLCSSIYRLVLTVMVLWGIHWLLRPLGLEIVAYYIVLLAIAGIAWRCLNVFQRIPSSLRENSGLRWGPALLVLGAMMGSSVLIFLVPVSDGVTARGIVRFRDMQPVYVPQSGRLVASIEREGRLQKGEVVYQLDSTDHQIREFEAFNEVQLLTQKIATRRELTALNPENDLQLPALERILESKQRQLTTIQAEGQSLVLRAASDSYWFHALPSFQPAIESLNLLTWTGFPLAGENLGANLEKGTLLGWLVQRKECIIEAFVSEKDVERIRVGAGTIVRVEYQVERSCHGEVLSIGTEPITYLPEELAADWFIMAQRDSHDRWVPDAPLFRVQVSVADAPADIVLGGRANIRIETNSATLPEKALRLLKQTIFYQRQKEF